MSAFFDLAQTAWINTGTGRPFMKNVSGGTQMGWVNTRLLAGFQSLGGAFGATGTTRFKLSIDSTGHVTWRCNSLDADPTSVITSTNTLTPGTTYHICGVVNFSSKSGIIYINGAADPSGVQVFTNMTAGNSSNTNCNLSSIGAREDGGNNWWNGTIEDVRIYDRALGPAEIATIYATYGKDIITTNLQARWPLNDGGPGSAVNQAADIGPNAFGGIATGGTVLWDSNTITTSSRPKRTRPVPGAW